MLLRQPPVSTFTHAILSQNQPLVDTESPAGIPHDSTQGERSHKTHVSLDDSDSSDNSEPPLNDTNSHEYRGDCDGWDCEYDHGYGNRMSWARVRKMEDATAEILCIWCGKSTAQKCAGCKSAVYCNQICQQNEWVIHKTVCKSFCDLPRRPSINNRPVMHSSKEQQNPMLQWLEAKSFIDDKLAEIFGMPLHPPVMDFNFRQGCDIQTEYSIFRNDDAFMASGIKPNRSIMKLMHGCRSVVVLGPCVLTSAAVEGSGYGMYMDVTPRTVHNFMDNMIWGGAEGEMPCPNTGSYPPLPKAGKKYNPTVARAEAQAV